MPALQTMTLHRAGRAALAALLLALPLGCADRGALIEAAHEVSDEFRKRYEEILREEGTRVYPRRRDDAVYRLRSAALRLGMEIESYDLDLGYVRFWAPAPQPLRLREWNEAAVHDLPLLRQIVRKHAGWLMQWLVPFEPEGLDIVINATVVPVPRGSEVSLSMRMREKKPPPTGFPRREYPPPTGVRMGLAKIWEAVDAEMGVRALSR